MEENHGFTFNAEETNYSSKKQRKAGFGRTIFIPFLAGLAGACLAIGIMFNVPQVKEKVIGKSEESATISFKTSTGETKTVVDMKDYSNTSIAVAEKALPSVVGITVNYKITSYYGQAQAEAAGSGIIISEDGYIVTNNHVISAESSSYFYTITEATDITVNIYGDDELYKATVIGTDEYTDIAILKIDKTGLTPATLGNSNDIKVGEVVYAIGNPVGMTYSVTSGIISAINRDVEAEGTTYTAIQTDAAINSGNSGGALVNSNGEVIGINTLKLAGTGVEGIGFAIPITDATDIMEQLIKYKTVKRPYIGIGGSAIDTYVAKRYDIPEGVYVEQVEKDSPADKAGLKEGDIITKIEGTEVSSVTELNKIKYKYNIGDTVTLTVYRDKQEQEIKIELTEMPEQEQQ